MPKLPKDILSCTFYLYPSESHAREGKGFGGTGFCVGVESQADPTKTHIYGLTNWHVACRDGCSVARMLKKDGTPVYFDFGPEDWQFIPGGDDIAAIQIPASMPDLDFKIASSEMFVTREHINSGHITVGDDVFMVGRFIDHDGGERNTPAA